MTTNRKGISIFNELKNKVISDIRINDSTVTLQVKITPNSTLKIVFDVSQRSPFHYSVTENQAKKPNPVSKAVESAAKQLETPIKKKKKPKKKEDTTQIND